MRTEFSLVELADMAREMRDRVCLASRPVGISLIEDPAQIPARAKRPSARGLVWPVCLAAVRAGRPLIILPCSGEKIFGHTEENDIFLACPSADLPRIMEGLLRTDFIQPYPTAKYLMFEPGIPRGYPIDYQSYRKHLSGES